MREPRILTPSASPETPTTPRAPKAFDSQTAFTTPDVFENNLDPMFEADVAPTPKKRGSFFKKLAMWTGTTLVALGLGLAADRLIRDLFARYDALGYIGLGLLILFIIAIAVLIGREVLAIMRLAKLDELRDQAQLAHDTDDLGQAKLVANQLIAIYSTRPDLARARNNLSQDVDSVLDGAELVRITERGLMAPLDARAKALTASSARRIALVTAVSPRALIDISFVIFESFRLARNLADLYGARSGFFGFVKLMGAILAHLAVTGGLVLTDGMVEQLVGQGLATKLSARLGEGVVNGLMTVRVGIAAIRAVRPMPFETQKSPVVTDFMTDLAKLNTTPKP